MTTRRDFLWGGGMLALAGAGATFATLQNMGGLDAYEAAVAATRAALRQDPEIGALLRYATLAPSGHNTQPWQFRVDGNRISISPDLTRRTPIVDPDNHHLFASLGCAAENLALSCGARGRPADLSFDPYDGGSVQCLLGAGPLRASSLFDAIPKRQSSRNIYDGKPVSNTDLRALTDAAAMPGVDLILITDRPVISQVRDLVIAGNTTQMSDPAFVRELRSWMRFSPNQALQAGDGLFTATTGNPILPEWLGPLSFDLAFKAQAENDKYASQIASSPGIAVFVGQKADPEHWILAGRAAQRFALQATALGLKHAFINQPVEAARQRPELATLVGLRGRRPDLVLRYGYGPIMPYSARRPVGNSMLL